MPEGYDDDTVTIVVPRKLAEDLYYAISIALGSRAGFTGGYFAEWGSGKKGTLGMTPKGKGSRDYVPLKYGQPSGPSGPNPKG
jgi:hypothetical protein